MASATMSTIIAQVLDDLYRTDLTSQATTAIIDAVKHYERKPWWFMEERATSSTVAGQEYYALPADFGVMDSLVINIGSTKYPLTRRSQEQIDDWAEVSATGAPTDYALYDQQIRLWLVPNDTYTMTMSYRAKLPELTAAASNAWTNICGELIRRRAAADLAFTILQDADRAAGFVALANDLYRELRSEHNQRVMPSHTRKRR